MKKTAIKNVFFSILTIFFLGLLATSCSKEEDPPIVFNAILADKTDVFIGEKITLTLDATDFSNAEVSTSNPAVQIIKKTSSTYEISADRSASATIHVSLKNNADTKNKSIILSFNQHGVTNFKAVEGIAPKVDKSAKVLTLLGEPDYNSDTTDGIYEIWVYPEIGLSFFITKKTKIVYQIGVYSSSFSFTAKNNTAVGYKTYPYEIGNGWRLEDYNTPMNLVVDELGTPNSKTSDGFYNNYGYYSKQTIFGFFSDDVNSYSGNYIASLIIY